jgi:uncharacterized repeat protein (TIGR01451 family)
MGTDPSIDRPRLRHRTRRRSLRLESLESRQLLADGSVTPTITGTVFQDANSDGQPSAGEGLADVTVRFYIDDGDGVFEPNSGDTLSGGNVPTDANGVYCVDNLDPDAAYFVFQPAQTVDGIALESQVSPLTRPGQPGVLIDAFTTTQEAGASPPAPSSDSSVLVFSDETEVIGRERDLMAFLDSGDGEVRVSANPFGNRPTLRYNADVAVTGSGVVVWDGIDSAADTLALGLDGVDLTNSGRETGIVFRIGAVATGASATLRLYQGSTTNPSEATMALPVTTGGSADAYVFLPFDDFVGPVLPSDVDAIELILSAESGGNNIEISEIGANGPKTVNLAVNPGADLAVTKTDNQTTAVPGEPLTYTVTVTNNGPSQVDGATVVDTFPPILTGVTFTSSTTGTASGNTASGTGDISDTVNISPGSSITYTITGVVSADASGTLTNTATVTAPTGISDPDLSNNTATDADNLTPNADLTITKSNDDDVSMPGRQTSYTIVVSNEGPSDVVGATVADTFPSSLTGVTYTSSATLGASGNTASGTGSINDTVDLASGSSITYTVQATVATNATGSITNTATVAVPTGTIDVDPSNNSASDTDSLTAEVDLRITKTDEVTNVQPGQVLQYTIVVNNDGPADAAGARITDAFPASLTNVSYTSSGTSGVTGNTASGTGNIDDTVTLPAGASLTYQVSATVAGNASGTLQNTVTVAAPTGAVDTLPSNNSATDIDSVTPVFDLSITKTNGQSSVISGQTTTYTIQVTNSGPSDVLDATVADTFTSSLTEVTFTSSASGGASGNTSNGAGNINDTVDMPAGSSITYTVTARVGSSATGTLTNTATVSSGSQNETNLDNNSATDTDTIVQQADLAITKTDNRTTSNPGDALTYQVRVTNNGPSDVTGATVADVMPSSLTGATFTSVASGGSSGNTNGSGSINDTVNLPAGSSITYTISATISPSATGTITNTATVAAPTSVVDTNSSNNSATDSTAIEQILRSISGYVYVDLNNNGLLQEGEPRIRDVTVSLTGTAVTGGAVSRATTTDGSGQYTFGDLVPGNYTVTETQPAAFGEGRETVGTGSLTNVQATDNVFANIGLGTEQDARNFNFGEQRPTLSKRDLLASRFA